MDPIEIHHSAEGVLHHIIVLGLLICSTHQSAEYGENFDNQICLPLSQAIKVHAQQATAHFI